MIWHDASLPTDAGILKQCNAAYGGMLKVWWDVKSQQIWVVFPVTKVSTYVWKKRTHHLRYLKMRKRFIPINVILNSTVYYTIFY